MIKELFNILKKYEDVFNDISVRMSNDIVLVNDKATGIEFSIYRKQGIFVVENSLGESREFIDEEDVVWYIGEWFDTDKYVRMLYTHLSKFIQSRFGNKYVLLFIEDYIGEENVGVAVIESDLSWNEIDIEMLPSAKGIKFTVSSDIQGLDWIVEVIEGVRRWLSDVRNRGV